VQDPSIGIVHFLGMDGHFVGRKELPCLWWCTMPGDAQCHCSERKRHRHDNGCYERLGIEKHRSVSWVSDRRAESDFFSNLHLANLDHCVRDHYDLWRREIATLQSANCCSLSRRRSFAVVTKNWPVS